jgi:hypothetical protein
MKIVVTSKWTLKIVPAVDGEQGTQKHAGLPSSDPFREKGTHAELPNLPFHQLEQFLIRTTALLVLVHALYQLVKQTYGF